MRRVKIASNKIEIVNRSFYDVTFQWIFMEIEIMSDSIIYLRKLEKLLRNSLF